MQSQTFYNSFSKISEVGNTYKVISSAKLLFTIDWEIFDAKNFCKVDTFTQLNTKMLDSLSLNIHKINRWTSP